MGVKLAERKKSEWHQTCQQQHKTNTQINKTITSNLWMNIIAILYFYSGQTGKENHESGIKVFHIYKVSQTWSPMSSSSGN